jgi:hypothetical protein
MAVLVLTIRRYTMKLTITEPLGTTDGRRMVKIALTNGTLPAKLAHVAI